MSVTESLIGMKPEGAYAPAQVEGRWRAYWREHDLFRADADSKRPPFTIVIPPPNVTGGLHIGHCLNNTTQDVVIRYRRMAGFEALWLPGTDHAGIATQNVVEKKLKAEGKSRHDLGREAFIAEVWKWKEKHHHQIVSQLDALGCSCDWSRERFTLDPGLSRAVRKVFVALYEKGLIYQGDYIVNWCPRCHTALSDEEVDHEEVKGELTTIRYPLADGSGAIEVATTRPETMLGDAAVAVHPADPRYRDRIGQTVRLPLLGRLIPIVADDAVDPEFGTGAVKVTPAHDPNDFGIGTRHGLTPILIMDGDGRMTPNAGPYAGLDRFEARKRVTADLAAQGLITGMREHTRPVGHCQRCHTVVEPMLSRQWFVKMGPLAPPALAAVIEGRVRLRPERWVGVYRHWMENVRDWCISRQLWWGHRIPAWTCGAHRHVIVAEEDPATCPECGDTALVQDEDVLDTWFSAWLWPFSTLGWPERTRDLERFYPTQFLSTGPDIIFFWVARMIVAGREFMGKEPFSDVNLHAIVRDGQGRKMSKSLGNSPDPLDLIAEHGADALRFTLMFLTPSGQDLHFDVKRLEVGRFFANKLWNASKLVIGNLPEEGAPPAEAAPEELADRWIRSRLAAAREAVTGALDRYEFQEAAKAIYEFIWHEYCDWYLELAKLRFYGEDVAARNTARRVAYEVMEESLRLLHPFMPFVTEDLWQRLPHTGLSIARAEWPAARTRDQGAEAEFQALSEVVTAVRMIRSEMNVPPGREAELIVRAAGEAGARLTRGKRMLESLAKVRLRVDPEAERPEAAASAVAGESELFLPLAGLIDLAAESRRLARDLERTERELATAGTRLESAAFIAKAPPEVVARERERLAELTQVRDKLARNLAQLGGQSGGHPQGESGPAAQ
jgi:valyl-tRNA synthetase